jgi:hypothetical protein
MKVPNFMKFALTFIRLAQKCESPVFHWTCTKGLFSKYLLRRICCQVLSAVRRRNSHLLSRAIFLSSRFCIPRPPWSLGWHRILHFAKRYFLLCSSLCQKKSRPKVIQLFMNSFWDFKEGHHVHGKAAKDWIDKCQSASSWKVFPFPTLRRCSNLSWILTQSLLDSFL